MTNDLLSFAAVGIVDVVTKQLNILLQAKVRFCERVSIASVQR
jgi:hypothetical protein